MKEAFTLHANNSALEDIPPTALGRQSVTRVNVVSFSEYALWHLISHAQPSLERSRIRLISVFSGASSAILLRIIRQLLADGGNFYSMTTRHLVAADAI
jgi:hypothetical protein